MKINLASEEHDVVSRREDDLRRATALFEQTSLTGPPYLDIFLTIKPMVAKWRKEKEKNEHSAKQGK